MLTMDDSRIARMPGPVDAIMAATAALGMDAGARLDTVDTAPEAMAIARQYLGDDSRVTFHLADGAEFLRGPGKFSHLDEALALLRCVMIVVRRGPG